MSRPFTIYVTWLISSSPPVPVLPDLATGRNLRCDTVADGELAVFSKYGGFVVQHPPIFPVASKTQPQRDSMFQTWIFIFVDRSYVSSFFVSLKVYISTMLARRGIPHMLFLPLEHFAPRCYSIILLFYINLVIRTCFACCYWRSQQHHPPFKGVESNQCDWW